jgi:hypothetical protein
MNIGVKTAIDRPMATHRRESLRFRVAVALGRAVVAAVWLAVLVSYLVGYVLTWPFRLFWWAITAPKRWWA